MNWVFVWRGFGDVDVYAADTKEELRAILDEINAVYEVSKEPPLMTIEDFEGKYVSIDVVRRAMNALLWNRMVSDDDSFEYGTGFVKVKRP